MIRVRVGLGDIKVAVLEWVEWKVVGVIVVVLL
jgi:hypothetical protein